MMVLMRVTLLMITPIVLSVAMPVKLGPQDKKEEKKETPDAKKSPDATTPDSKKAHLTKVRIEVSGGDKAIDGAMVKINRRVVITSIPTPTRWESHSSQTCPAVTQQSRLQQVVTSPTSRTGSSGKTMKW